ncbi:GGDEF domain-containing protein [Amedibacillus sp. YH-ame10]
MQTLEISNNLILDTLIKDYRSVLKVDLNSGNIEVMKTQNSSIKSKSLFWEEYVELLLNEIYEEDRTYLNGLSLEQAQAFYQNENTLFPFKIRVVNKEQKYDWVKVNARIMDSGKRELLITTQIDNENHMMQKIIDLYVLNNLDYFVLVDAHSGSYKMFSGNPNSLLPPESGTDYEHDVREYNKSQVVPEEEEEVTKIMMLANVIKELEKQDVFEFTAGFFDLQNEYHRSRVQFSYYDRCAGLIVITRTDITQIYLDEGKKERKLAKALREAKHDSMTQLYNNKESRELIGKAIQQQYRAKAVVCFIDLDNFKLVNDNLGHQIGDQVICHVAQKLRSISGKDGIAGRLGGDEFVLFLPVTSSMDNIQGYVQSICDSLSDCSVLTKQQLPVSCSVGISVYPDDGTGFEELLSKADRALYHAKRHGKNRYSFYFDTMKKQNNSDDNLEL